MGRDNLNNVNFNQTEKNRNTGEKTKQKKSFRGIFTLIIAILALLFSLQEKFSSKNASLNTMNQMITDKLVPNVKQTSERDLVGHIYDMKRMMVTLEEIKETSKSEEIRTMITKLQRDIEEINIKLFVLE